MTDDFKPYTTGEIAALCHVTINAVKKWIASGKLAAFRTPGGHYRVGKTEFLEFLEKYKMEVKESLFPERPKVLIVDDEAEVITFIEGALESMHSGYRVETAADGYEALIKVGDFKPELLILDLRMPKIDGFEVCTRIKEDPSTKGIKILAVSAYGPEDINRIIECGADSALPKPLKLKEFQRVVARLLG